MYNDRVLANQNNDDEKGQLEIIEKLIQRSDRICRTLHITFDPYWIIVFQNKAIYGWMLYIIYTYYISYIEAVILLKRNINDI